MTTMLLVLLLLAILFACQLLVNADGDFWVTQDELSQDMLDTIVFIVKDNEGNENCNSLKSNTKDVRYSDKRHLMCVGSILTNRYILTSASCVHEATFIRHNIQLPIAAMVLPFSDAAQVIKVLGFNIHPQHVVDPRDAYHALHDIAIAKLACRIAKNVKTIDIPHQSFAEQCEADDCTVAIIKKISWVSFMVSESPIEKINYSSRKRRQNKIAEIKSLKEGANEDVLNTFKTGKVNKNNKNEFAVQFHKILEKTYNKRTNNIVDSSKSVKSRVLFVRDNNIEQIMSIVNQNAKKIYNLFKKLIIPNEKLNRRIFTREATGINSCTKTGSPIMLNKILVGMVSASCDDRQPETAWQFTYSYDNLDWLNKMMGNSENLENGRMPSGTSGRSPGGGCNIYNYFIDSSNKKTLCRTDSASLNQLGEIPKCANDYSGSKLKSNSQKTSKSELNLNDVQLLRKAYKKSIYKMYHNTSLRGSDNNNLEQDLGLMIDLNARDPEEVNYPDSLEYSPSHTFRFDDPNNVPVQYANLYREFLEELNRSNKMKKNRN